MYKVLANGSEDFIAIQFSKKVTGEDYKSLIPLLKEKLQKDKRINLYWEFENFEGWDLGSVMREIQFDLTHANQFNKIAVVGDAQWQKIATLLGNYLTKAEIQYFDKSQQLQAMNWITGDRSVANEDVYKNSSLLD